MSYVFNGPGVLIGEEKNGDSKSKRITIEAGKEIPDGFVCNETMKLLEKQGKISKRTFVDKIVKPKKEDKTSEEKEENQSDERNENSNKKKGSFK